MMQHALSMAYFFQILAHCEICTILSSHNYIFINCKNTDKSQSINICHNETFVIMIISIFINSSYSILKKATIISHLYTSKKPVKTIAKKALLK